MRMDDVSLREYVDMLFEERLRAHHDTYVALDKRIDEQVQALRDQAQAQREAVSSAFAASEKAILKADAAYEKRFDDANEWRGQSADRERTQQDQIAEFRSHLLPRETFEAILEQWDNWRAGVDHQLTANESSQAGSAKTIAMIFAVAGFISTCIAIILVVGDVLTSP